MRSWKRKVALLTIIFWAVGYTASMTNMSVYAEEQPEEVIIFVTDEPIIADVPEDSLFENPQLTTELIFAEEEDTTPGAVIEQHFDIYEEIEEEPVNKPLDNHLTKSGGTFFGPSGKETWYNLDMSTCLAIMAGYGYNYEYWVRDDGVKMYGYYVMVAANTSIYPKGTILDTSMGKAIVVDRCAAGFIDICVTW